MVNCSFLMMLVIVWLYLSVCSMWIPSSFASVFCASMLSSSSSHGMRRAYFWCWVGIEDGVVGFGWVWNKVVAVEVGDEAVEF